MRGFLIASLCFIAGASSAEPISGVSYIGMCSSRFPCSEALSIQPEAIGYLADAFGHKCQCVQEALKSPKLRYVRVHISNGTCFPERGRRCGRGDVFYNETQKSAERKILNANARTYLRFNARLMSTIQLLEQSEREVRYSPMMESPFRGAVRRKLLKVVENAVGKERTVDSVVNQKCIPGYICERHGDSPQYQAGERCISDLDGITLFDANLENLKSRSEQCEAILYWTYGCNLLPYNYKGSFIPPLRRNSRLEGWEIDGLRKCLG